MSGSDAPRLAVAKGRPLEWWPWIPAYEREQLADAVRREGPPPSSGGPGVPPMSGSDAPRPAVAKGRPLEQWPWSPAYERENGATSHCASSEASGGNHRTRRHGDDDRHDAGDGSPSGMVAMTDAQWNPGAVTKETAPMTKGDVGRERNGASPGRGREKGNDAHDETQCRP